MDVTHLEEIKVIELSEEEEVIECMKLCMCDTNVLLICCFTSTT